MNSCFCSPGRIVSYPFYSSLFYLLTWCCTPAGAQSINNAVVLTVGDTVPDVIIPNIQHYKSSEAKLSDFKGKLLILDFWATWCSPCIASIPRMDSLQRKFKDQLQILPVAYQAAQEIDRFRDRLAKQKGWRIVTPEVTGDTILSQLFPHNVYPHYVWINERGIVIAMTSGDEISESNISMFLQAESYELSQKNDLTRPAYDSKTTTLSEFLTNAHRGPAYSYHSISTGFIEGLPGGYHIENLEETTGPVRITFTNISPLWLFKIAYGEARNFFGDSFFSIEVRNPELLESDAEGKRALEWYRQNGICYELSVPGKLRKDLWEIFRQDLHRLLPSVEASIQKRKKKSLALVRTSTEDKLKSKSDNFSETQDGLSLAIRNSTLQAFVTNLNLYNMPSSLLPLVDMSGYTDKVDMDLEANLANIESLNAALAHYDLRFIEKEVELDILVIRDKPAQAEGN